MALTDPLIINAALTGMVPTRADSPHVPLTIAEIAEDARRCRAAGASIVHLHARDAAGRPSADPVIHQQLLAAIRAACPDVILCASTSGRVHHEFAQRSAPLDCTAPAPEMASLTLGSMNFAREESVNPPAMIAALARRMRECRIMPELEVFDLGMAEYANTLLKDATLTAPLYCNILLGSRGTLAANAFNLSLMIRALPPNTLWAAAGIGRFQFDMNVLAIALGGHVRVGLEDNLWFDPARTIPATNLSLIERLTAIARAIGRPIATPAEARRIINLPPLPLPA